MITIARATVDTVQKADGPDDLHESLRNAMKLEHSTIPLYLTAHLSLSGGDGNADIAETLRSIVVEEMMHFTITGNVLNALGGTVAIDTADMVPVFPGPLPMQVDAQLGDISVERMSPDQCAVFMKIEEPDDPVGLPPREPGVTTIGDFYQAIIDKIAGWDETAFAHPTAQQVVSPFYPDDQLFPIVDVPSAVRALKVVVEQGEGTTTRPTIEKGSAELAHYYRFGEIVNKKRFVADPAAPEGFAYSGDDVLLDEAAVFPLLPNAKLADYAQTATSLQLATRFHAAYRHLLTSLQKTFAGSPDELDTALGLMFELRTAALAMMATPDPDRPGFCLTPTWQY